MKKLFALSLTIGLLMGQLVAQTDSIAFVKKSEAMIPMRDGVKLFTIIYSPINPPSAGPILLQRTPYGAFGTR
jgi:predicted acyl esterase